MVYERKVTMKWTTLLYLSWVYILSFQFWYALGELGDPYKILGVNDRATTAEIRKAYKRLARET